MSWGDFFNGVVAFCALAGFVLSLFSLYRNRSRVNVTARITAKKSEDPAVKFKRYVELIVRNWTKEPIWIEEWGYKLTIQGGNMSANAPLDREIRPFGISRIDCSEIGGMPAIEKLLSPYIVELYVKDSKGKKWAVDTRALKAELAGKTKKASG